MKSQTSLSSRKRGRIQLNASFVRLTAIILILAAIPLSANASASGSFSIDQPPDSPDVIRRTDHPSGFFYYSPFFESIYDHVQIDAAAGQSGETPDTIDIYVRSFSTTASTSAKSVEYLDTAPLLISFDWSAQVQVASYLTDGAFSEVGYYLGSESYALFTGSDYSGSAGTVTSLLKSAGVPFGMYSISIGGNMVLHASNISIQPIPEPLTCSLITGGLMLAFAAIRRRPGNWRAGSRVAAHPI
jgi:hypothetical protein